MYILYSSERNGWGPARCIYLPAPSSIPPPYWMQKYAVPLMRKGIVTALQLYRAAFSVRAL